MKEAQLINDRNAALKLALSELGCSGSGKSEAQNKIKNEEKGTNSKKKRDEEQCIR